MTIALRLQADSNLKAAAAAVLTKSGDMMALGEFETCLFKQGTHTQCSGVTLQSTRLPVLSQLEGAVQSALV